MEEAEHTIQLGKLMRDEVGSHLPFDYEWTKEWLRGMVLNDTDRTYANVFNAYKDEQPVGFLIGFCRPYIFSEATVATQELWYVLEECRAGRAAYKLIKAFEEWARLRGALEIFTGVTAGDSVTMAKIGSVLKRMGYPMVGTHHKKRTV